MTLDEAIERYTSNAEYERTHGNLQGCLEFRLLAEWLKDYKRLLEQEPKTAHWIMRHRKVNTINYRTGEDVLTGEIHTVKELIRYETDEPYCAACGKRAEDISQGYCGYCGARMVDEQESEE